MFVFPFFSLLYIYLFGWILKRKRIVNYIFWGNERKRICANCLTRMLDQAKLVAGPEKKSNQIVFQQNLFRFHLCCTSGKAADVANRQTHLDSIVFMYTFSP